MEIVKTLPVKILIERKDPTKCSQYCRYLEWGWVDAHYCTHFKRKVYNFKRCRACVRDFGRGEAE